MKDKAINGLIHTLKTLQNLEVSNEVLNSITEFDNKLQNVYKMRELDFNDEYQNELIQKGVPTLKSIYDKLVELKKQYPNYKVYVDMGFANYAKPICGFCSYRGKFSNVAIEYRDVTYHLDDINDVREMDDDSLSVKSLVEHIEQLFDGELLEGYKGGEYRMGYSTPTFVSLPHEADDMIPVDFEVVNKLENYYTEIILLKIGYFEDE